MAGLLVRNADAADVDAINRIFDHYVASSHVTFEAVPMSAAQRTDWIQSPGTSGVRLVCEEGGEVVGWASSKPLSPRMAYRHSVEVSVYVRDGSTGRGIGRRLIETLLEHLEELGAHRVYAVIGLPNPQSTRLFESLGFTPCSLLSEAGRKFGKWWDVAWYEYRVPTRS